MNLFEKESLALFAYQFEHNPVYRSFCDLTNVSPSDVKSTLQIPFLPITFFLQPPPWTANQPIRGGADKLKIDPALKIF